MSNDKHKGLIKPKLKLRFLSHNIYIYVESEYFTEIIKASQIYFHPIINIKDVLCQRAKSEDATEQNKISQDYCFLLILICPKDSQKQRRFYQHK